MAQGRRRAPKPTRGGRRQGSGVRVPWLWFGLLAVAGGAILAVRTLGLTSWQAPQSAEPTLSVARTAVGAASTRTPPAARAVSTPGAEATPRLTPAGEAAAPTAVRAVPTAVRATPVPTRLPAAVATAAALARATPTSLAPTSTSGQSRATPTSPQTPAAARVPAENAVAPTSAAVALTFDAGADRGYAEDILDILQEQHVSASFGITGQWAKANPDLVRRMAADGHMIINHTLDHHSFTGVSDQLGGLSAARRRAELEDADAIIAPLIGHSTRPWFRLPYGDDDAHVVNDVAPAGYSRKVGWTVDSLGWKGAQSTDIVARCVKLAAPGGVFVLHVGRASQDAIALPQIIQGLRDKGFGFTRVDAV